MGRHAWIVLTLCLFAQGLNAQTIDSASSAHAFMVPWLASCPQSSEQELALRNCLQSGVIRAKCLVDQVAPQHGAITKQVNNDVLAAYEPGGSGTDGLVSRQLGLLREIVTDGVLPTLSGTVDDFSNTLLPSLLETSDSLAEPQTLGMAVNLPRLFGLKMRLGAFSNPAAEINPALETALIKRGQLEAFRSAENRLDVGDDYFVQVDATLVNSWFGRDQSDHAALLSRLARSAIAGSDLASGDYISQRFQRAAIELLQKQKPDEVAINAGACALHQYGEHLKSERMNQVNAYLGEYWRLVHNQPQLTLSYRELNRDGIVGANSESLRIKLSSGIFNNINFLRWTGACSTALGGDHCPAIYRKIQERNWFLRHGVGASVYFEMGRIADLRVQLPSLTEPVAEQILPPLVQDQLVSDDNVFQLEGGDYRRAGWSVGGMLLQMSGDEAKHKSSMRIDAGVDYYRYDRDSLRFDHNVGRVTLTYRRGSFSFPLHIMYRTESEFNADLGDDVVIGLGLQSSFSRW